MELFEAELARRGLRYSAASSPGQYVVWAHGARPKGHQDEAGYREPVSPGLDRVLVHADAAGALVRGMTARALAEMGLSAGTASQHAWSSLDTALAQAEQVTYPAPGGAALLSFATALPSKASLLLAPSLRTAVEGAVGWPVLAVAPDRDFVYVWNAGHRDLIGRLGGVVIREHARAPYPLSAEIFEIGDSIRAIGSYQG
jgi:hypothetical protein